MVARAAALPWFSHSASQRNLIPKSGVALYQLIRITEGVRHDHEGVFAMRIWIGIALGAW